MFKRIKGAILVLLGRANWYRLSTSDPALAVMQVAEYAAKSTNMAHARSQDIDAMIANAKIKYGAFMSSLGVHEEAARTAIKRLEFTKARSKELAEAIESLEIEANNICVDLRGRSVACQQSIDVAKAQYNL